MLRLSQISKALPCPGKRVDNYFFFENMIETEELVTCIYGSIFLNELIFISVADFSYQIFVFVRFNHQIKWSVMKIECLLSCLVALS